MLQTFSASMLTEEYYNLYDSRWMIPSLQHSTSGNALQDAYDYQRMSLVFFGLVLVNSFHTSPSTPCAAVKLLVMSASFPVVKLAPNARGQSGGLPAHRVHW